MATPSVGARIGGVPVDGGALAQGDTAEARASLVRGNAAAAAIADAGRAINDIGRRVLAARESAELMEADALAKRAYGDYMAGLPEDPSDWQESWKTRAAHVRQEILSQTRLSGAGRRKLESNLDAWDAEAQTRLSSMSIQRHAQIARVKSDYAASEAIERRDLDGYAEISAGRVAAGISTPEEESIRMREAIKTVNRAEFGDLITTDPWAAESVMTGGRLDWMTPDDQTKAARAIKYAQSQRRGEEADQIQNAIAGNPDMSESLVRQMLGQSHLGEADQAKLLDVWRRDSKPDFGVMAKLRGDVLALTADSPVEDVWAMQERIKVEAHPEYQGQFMHLLGNSVGERGNDNATRNFRQGSGMIGATVDRYSRSMDEMEIAKTKVVLENELEVWTRSNPDATQTEMFDFLKGMGVAVEKGGVDAIAAPGLYMPPPPELTEDDLSADLRRAGADPLPDRSWIGKLLNNAPDTGR